MARLLIHVEGQTEEAFVNEVLRQYLVSKGYHSVDARIVGNARLRGNRGGIRAWPAVRRDIVNHLREDPGCIATTMVDYYGMPKDESGGWPGRAKSKSFTSVEGKAHCVQDALGGDLAKEMGSSFHSARFIPFVVMHEFEALLFSDCAAFSRGIDRADLEDEFRRIREDFPTPEEINDSTVTAPSKRVKALLPSYQKPLFGVLAALEIGLPRMREACPHFDWWLGRLESHLIFQRFTQ